MGDTPFIVPAVRGIEATLREAYGSGPNENADVEAAQADEMLPPLRGKRAEAEADITAAEATEQQDRDTARELLTRVSGLQATRAERQIARNREIVAHTAVNARDLGLQDHAEGCEIHALDGACEWLRDVRIPDDMDAVAVARLALLRVDALIADIECISDRAHTEAATYDVARQQGHVLIIGARQESLARASAEARRAVKVAEDGLRDLRARRAARDAAKKSVGTITRANVGACIPTF
jgi:hypothetical protein